MISVVLSLIIVVHAIIHLTAFTKGRNTDLHETFSSKTTIFISKNTSKIIGLLWLVNSILLFVSAYAYYLQKDWFWIIGVASFTISQGLIILNWPEAKWGTLINVILLFVILGAAARIQFNKMVKKEVINLISTSLPTRSFVREDKVTTLPNVVQNWLRTSHVVGLSIPTSIHIVQKGSMRSDENSGWMPFDAEQYFSINPPGFVWRATIHTDKLIDIVGRDKYENGKGNMLIKASSLIPIANNSGDEIDQGTMIRFMAEVIWFPHAAVSNYLHWEEIDSTHAQVTMTYKGVTASGIYTFNRDGLPIGFEAQRYGEFKGKFSKELWSVSINNYKYFHGVPIGNFCEVTWKLKDRNFTWLKLSIVDLNYQ